jgi:hypothetical protein
MFAFEERGGPGLEAIFKNVLDPGERGRVDVVHGTTDTTKGPVKKQDFKKTYTLSIFTVSDRYIEKRETKKVSQRGQSISQTSKAEQPQQHCSNSTPHHPHHHP